MQSHKLGILSAVTASICCIGPLLVILLGLGSLGLTAFFSQYHWLFIGVGIALLAVAWGYFYREKKRCDSQQCEFRNKNITRNTLIAASLVVVLFAGLNFYTYAGASSSTGQAAQLKADSKFVQTTLPVEGMTCFTCEIAVEQAVKKVSGVVTTDASAKNKSLTVQYDPAKTNPQQIGDAVNETGYRASLPETK